MTGTQGRVSPALGICSQLSLRADDREAQDALELVIWRGKSERGGRARDRQMGPDGRRTVTGGRLPLELSAQSLVLLPSPAICGLGRDRGRWGVSGQRFLRRVVAAERSLV